jgi:hypothetical protein
LIRDRTLIVTPQAKPPGDHVRPADYSSCAPGRRRWKKCGRPTRRLLQVPERGCAPGGRQIPPFASGRAFGWRTVVAAELVFGVAGSTGDLGWNINNARYYLLVPDVFAGLIVISILGIAVDLVFGVIEQRTVVRWGMKTPK